ncbi:MAG: AlpA family phage regulatory protein [Acidovorax sp.]|nr:AlpA family phage regulatory protein [Acidovorax sp.]
MTTATLAPKARKARKKQTQDGTPKAAAQHTTAAIPCFDELPDSALVRQSQLVRDPKHPTRPTPLPFSPATFWRKVKDGAFPKPVKLGERITAWKVGDVRAWMAAQAAA